MAQATMTFDPRPEPWLSGDVVVLVWTTLLGLTGVLVGYLGVSGTVDGSSQLVWTAVAIGAVAVGGLGNAVWLAAAARAVKARKQHTARRIEGLLVSANLTDVSDVTDVTELVDHSADNTDEPVSGRGMTRYHRAACVMARGKNVKPSTVAAHERAGRRPCEICQPDASAPSGQAATNGGAR